MKEQIKPTQEENKRLIAEFMGAYVGNPVDGKEVMCGVPAYYSKKGHTNTHLTSDLKYNTSWDWLMPVIEKISNLEIKFLNADEYFNPYPVTFGMQNEDGLCMFRFYAHSLHCHQNLIDAAYEAVVEFLTSHMKGVNTNG